MQIKDNITATTFDAAIQKLPQKMVKLRAMENVVKNAQEINKMLAPAPIQEEAPKTEEVATPVEMAKESEVNPEIKDEVPSEIKEESSELPLTSADVLRNKKDILGIEAYTDLTGNIVPFASIQAVSRRLKTNPVVPGNINRERNVNGMDRPVVSEVKEESVEKMETPTFDFSSLPGVDNSKEEKISNDKLDEWLNKEIASDNTEKGDETVLNEVTKLQTTLNDNTSSLATQKEILEGLRARVANYEALCQARKKELEERNMDITRELNDVLAEINELTNLENQYKNELELGSESIDKSKVA